MSNIQQLFLSKELSLLAKEKGFNEECLFFYNDIHYPGKLMSNINNVKNSDCMSSTSNNIILAPLYQQIIDWFREKHNLVIYVDRDGGWWIGIIKDISAEEQESPKIVYAHMADEHPEALTHAIQEA